jgi:hypothetical protein
MLSLALYYGDCAALRFKVADETFFSPLGTTTSYFYYTVAAICLFYRLISLPIETFLFLIVTLYRCATI